LSVQDVSVAEAKSHLSEYISRCMYNHERIIITKRKRKVAAIVSIEDLEAINQNIERKGLAAIIGQWENGDELENVISTNLKKFRGNSGKRNVSL